MCPTVGQLFLTGGAFLGHYQGKKDVDWYGDVLEAIGKRLIQWPFTSFHVGALAEEDMKRIHATGVPDGPVGAYHYQRGE